MTLDEAIKHAEEVANDMELCCKECAEEHKQLAEWLKELKKYREQAKINHNSTENNDNDLVSRKAVIDMMNKIFFDNDFAGFRIEYGSQGAMYYAINYVKELPSYSAEQKIGHWISLDDFRGKYNENGFMCSECVEHIDFEENFCPNCGAKMKEGDTE